MKKVDYIVIGAGLTGLITAWELQKKGFSVLILEKENRVGGYIQSEQKDGFLYEKGPNSGVFSNPEVAGLLDELQDHVELEMAADRVKNRFILKEGEWQKLPLTPKDMLFSPLFRKRDKLNLLLEPFRPKGKKEAETLEELALRRLGESFLDYAIDPFVGGIYAGDPSKLVPKYALPKMYQLEQKHGSFIGGMIVKGLKKKSPEEKRTTRGIYSFKGGLEELTKALSSLIGEENILLNCENVRVTSEESGYKVLFQQESKEAEISSQKVISTLQGHLIHSIFPSLKEEPLKPLNDTPYANIIEITLGFKKWQGMELDGFGGLIPFKEQRDLLGVLFLSSCFAERAPKDGALLTAFIGGVRHEHLSDFSDEEIRGIVKRELTDLLKVKEFTPDLIHIGRHKKAIPQYDANHGKRLTAIKSIEGENPGFYILGNSSGGIGMADRILQGRRFVQSLNEV